MTVQVRRAGASTHAVVVGVEDRFDFRSAEYQRLFQASGASAFQGPAWLDGLYRVLAPGLGVRAHVVTVRRADTGELALVIPLVLQRSMGMRILQPADLGVSDYNSVVAAPEVLASLAADGAAREAIDAALAEGDVLIFRKIRRCPEAIAALLGGGTRSRNENDGYEIVLDGGSFEEWQATRLRKKFRKGMLRRLRRLEAEYGPVAVRTFTEPDEIEAAIRFIATRRPVRFRDDILGRAAYLDFYIRQAVAGAQSGAAVTSGLLVRGELAAANFGIVSGNVYHSLLCGARIEEMRDFAPGLQAMLAVLRQRQELGETRFDFGIGGGRHKTDLSATPVPLYNLTVARSVGGRAISLVYNHARPLKTAITRMLGDLR